ncbi:MAG: hypothetical protein HFI86_05915 [Bacilli bacterium]|nr:hypothetical protein [Bacilli bacterium]
MIIKQTQTFNGSTGSNEWAWKQVVTEGFNDDYISTNKSVINVKTYLTRTNSNSQFGGNADCNIKCKNSSKEIIFNKDVNKTFNWPTNVYVNSWILIQDETFEVSHNVDGSQKIIVESMLNTSDFAPNWTYAYGELTLNTIPRYATSNQSFNSKTETSITMNWSSDNTIDYIWYSKDNGSNWIAVGSVNSKSGTYTISGLSANTSYNIKTRVRRKDSQLTTDSTSTSITTYNYPYITAVGGSNLIIGSSQTLTLYNPLKRNCIVKMNKDLINGTQLYSGSTADTSITFTPNSTTLYNSIPNTTSSKCVYSVVYLNVTKTTEQYTYTVDTNSCIPTFNNFTYEDTNNSIVAVTGNNQVLVKGLSNLLVKISSANKMIAKNSATAKNYNAIIDTLNKSVDYSNNDISMNLGAVVNNGTKRLTVTAYDSRNISKSVYKDIIVYDYSKPVINVEINRLNNFETETTLKVNGSYTRLTINNVDKNKINQVQYRYKELNGDWGNWNTLATNVSNGKFTCSDVILSLDNTKSFEFEVRAVDNLQTQSNFKTLDIGQAIFFISSNKKKCYINGDEILMYDIVDEW